MYDIQKNYKNAIGTINQLQMTGQGKKMNGVYYQIVSDEEIKRVQSELKSHLEI